MKLAGLLVFNCLLLGVLAGDAYAQSFASDDGYAEGRSSFDFDHDGGGDKLRVIGDAKRGFFLACTFSSTQATLISAPIDPGFAADRKWVDVSGDGVPDYCRFVGGDQNQRVSCNITRPLVGWSADIISPVTDWGYPETRTWTVVNGKAQFCRGIGDHNSPQTVCSSW